MWTIAKVSSYPIKYIENYLNKHKQKYKTNPYLYLLDYLNRYGIFNDQESKLIADPEFRSLYTVSDDEIVKNLHKLYFDIKPKDISRVEAIYLILGKNSKELASTLPVDVIKYAIKSGYNSNDVYRRKFSLQLYIDTPIHNREGFRDLIPDLEEDEKTRLSIIKIEETKLHKIITEDGLGERDLNIVAMSEAYFMTICKNVYPYIPKVYSVNDNIITMEYIEGELLEDYLRNNQKREIYDSILTRILYIISKLATINVSHNDMHLSNFIIGKNNNLWLIDFGLAEYGENKDIRYLSSINMDLHRQGIDMKFESDLINFLPEKEERIQEEFINERITKEDKEWEERMAKEDKEWEEWEERMKKEDKEWEERMAK